eukprot:COSAG05_NODE_12549_length_463_cov_2.107143_2_plen_33_part_01
MLKLDSCVLTFNDTLVLRAATVKFSNQVLTGGI